MPQPDGQAVESSFGNTIYTGIVINYTKNTSEQTWGYCATKRKLKPKGFFNRLTSDKADNRPLAYLEHRTRSSFTLGAQRTDRAQHKERHVIK